MSAEATNPATPGPVAGPVTPVVSRRKARARIDLRRLGRAALLGPASRDRLPDAIGHVVDAHRAHHPDADLEPLRRAYVLAESSHRGQMRKSGEPYITHPLAVTLILAELGAETTTLTASLLHDTVEDTDVTLDQVGEQFGEEVRFLVDGVTKLEKVDYGAAAEPETFRKMLVATGNDVRVMSIKLADRLHNMRTLGVMRPEKQARIAKVTRDVLIPLAERLGVQALKTELEDLVFAILHPEEYEHTRELIVDNASRADDPLAEMAVEMRKVLREAGIPAEVLIRPRHFVSVHRVARKRGRLRGADFGRLLVLVNEDADCYGVLGELHTCMTPVVSEFKDFIAVPKFNLYQSLHTAVAREDGQVTEVLIRTHQMHKVAEAGVVALGNPYAPPSEEQSASSDGERVDPTRPGWLSRLLDWQEAAPDPDTFWSTLREDLAQDREITVFRPDGGTLGLPEGATCVDAAYAQYGEDAHACIGARVNGRLATLSTVLRDGDTVQLLMGQDPASEPSREWLEHAHTPAARIAIQRWLATHPPQGETTAAEQPGVAFRPGTGGPASQDAATGGPAVRRAAEAPAVRRAAEGPAVRLGAEGPAGRSAAANVLVDRPGATVRLAGCCTPVPPDEVTGFSVRGGAVTVHRVECAAVARMKSAGRAEVGVRWGDTTECRVTLVAESFVRPHLLADLTEAMALEGAEIVSATVEPPSQQRVRHTYTVQLPDAALLPGLMRAMRNVAGVYDVSRAQPQTTQGA
ncbi:bifunctional (p)ppGpp synthetase/guanosine-3',5'-bis(diphosphate) 3'-pyrophosphohydrolase [Streptomyces sp. ISL-22]|uniref:RelA/SpoT family protein n=1 Tax=unclassified Streptomyces TaxID=2593676 RepID=UPI001BEAE196|nr:MULTISPECIES: HD domain-containing protein [unclassified Streptomyces]MBT2419590.1 bifunctional (p)ppGpp synthetase/guanosine-3',5'-bis(diphosphate) 3'-pyrophosphohydrolase [Streptomyces sp. ISL-24]MBT2432585.1 bifunctional (p)ppGpp synthetase/guanosine-3',5'-bis(diphosphate) 3'-pyrophosphohydrolase [Streptomyces sp. ISL-22]